MYVEGPAKQRITFRETDMIDSESGFLIPSDGVEFILEAGDEIWMTGQTVAGDPSYVYIMVTKLV